MQAGASLKQPNAHTDKEKQGAAGVRTDSLTHLALGAPYFWQRVEESKKKEGLL